MKNILILACLLLSLPAIAQYPASPTTKVDLGRQTTGDGLTFRGAGAPAYTPSSKNNAWVYLDTLTGITHYYYAGDWRTLPNDKTVYPLAKNVSGGQLVAGTVVSVDDTDPATGDKINIVAAEGDGTKPAKLILGVLRQTLADNGEGYVQWFGRLNGLSLPALQPGGETWAEGDILYLSGTIDGGLTKVVPTKPALDIPIALILRINGNNLTLLVRPTLGEKLGELHDVSVSGATDGQVLTYQSSTGLWVPTNGLTDGDKGDITVSSSGTVWNIDAGAVGETELATDAVTGTKIATGAVGTDELANSSVTSAKIGDNQVVESKIAAGAVTETKLGTGAVTETKIGTGAVTETKIASDAVTSAKIATGAVGSSEIAAGAVGESELASSSVTNAKLAADAVTTDKIQAGAVQESDIATGAVTATKIGTGAVGATQLASTTVTAGSYTAANITVDEDGRLTSAASNTSVVTGSGASGQVSFWTGAQTQSGSNDLFWDNANGRLGVGTNTPSQRLVVQGTTATDGAQLGANILSKAGWSGFGVNWTTTDTTSFTHVTGNTGTLTHSAAAINAQLYQITWTVTGRTAGTFTIAFGGYTSGNLSASGNIGSRATSTASLVITPTSTFDGTVTVTIQTISPNNPLVVYNNSAGGVSREMRITTSNTNFLDGIGAGQSITTGTNNFAQGLNAGQSITTGTNNFAQGLNAGQSNTIGNFWIAQGAGAGQNSTTGGGWIAQGGNAGLSNTTGSNWIAQGSSAGRNNTTGNSWIAQGSSAGRNNTTGNNWIAQGFDAARNNTTGSGWVAQGTNAAINNTSGSNWNAQGFEAGRYWSNGVDSANFTNSVYIGALTRAGGTTGARDNENVFGYFAIGNGDNTVTLGNSSIVGHYLSGTGAVRVPTGTGAQQPSGVEGFVRFNTTTDLLDVYNGTAWRRVVDIADATPNTEDVVSWTGSAFSAVASRRGIVSGTPDGSGDLTLTFGTAMPDATYSATATAEGTTAYIITVHTKATGSVKFRVFDDAGAAVTSGTITVNYQITDY